MANNKQANSKIDTDKKTTSTNKNVKSNAIKKTNTTKSSSKKTIKNSTSKNINKTKTNKTTQNKSVKKVDSKEIEVKKVELADILVEKDNTNIEEKKNIEVINNENKLKLEEAKFPKKRDKKLLGIGIFVITLGIVALFITLIANRIVDREFLSDSSITLMMVASIIIEGFGAFIIINES